MRVRLRRGSRGRAVTLIEVLGSRLWFKVETNFSCGLHASASAWWRNAAIHPARPARDNLGRVSDDKYRAPRLAGIRVRIWSASVPRPPARSRT